MCLLTLSSIFDDFETPEAADVRSDPGAGKGLNEEDTDINQLLTAGKKTQEEENPGDSGRSTSNTNEKQEDQIENQLQICANEPRVINCAHNY